MLKLVRAKRFSAITIDEICEKAEVSRRTFYRYYSDKKFFSHSFEVKGQNGFWEEVKTILMPYFQQKFPSVGEADRMRDFFLETDIYRELTLLEEWIRGGMKLTPEEFADALRKSYIVYATWITEVATGKPATEFPAEMVGPVAYIKN